MIRFYKEEQTKNLVPLTSPKLASDCCKSTVWNSAPFWSTLLTHAQNIELPLGSSYLRTSHCTSERKAVQQKEARWLDFISNKKLFLCLLWYPPILVPSRWYALPLYLPSKICWTSEGTEFLFLGVDVAGTSSSVWLLFSICMLNPWLFSLWLDAAHRSCSSSVFASFSPLAWTPAARAAAGSTSWSDSTTQGEGVRRSSAVSQDIIERWLSWLYPPALRSSMLLLRSRSARARVTRSPSLLTSR